MKNRITSSLLVLLLTIVASADVWAQKQTVKAVDHQRITVDKRFDRGVDAEAEAFLAPFKRQVDSINSPVVGTCARDLKSDRPESEMSNLLADILVWSARKEYKEKVDFAVYNIGGIRADFPKGQITIGDVVEVAPFENKICFMTMKGTDVLELFSQIALRGGEGVSAGIRLVIDVDKTVKSLTINGKPVNPKANYRVATIDYLAEGNDGMPAFRKGTKVVAPKAESNNTRFIIMNYFREKAKNGESVDAQVEGRIVAIAPEVQPTREIVIIHSNDTHSQILPFSTNIKDTLKAGRAGYMRRVNYVKQEREANPDKLLLLDSGDFSQGSPFYTMFRGDVEVGLMNIMGYDAATIGNHEFDFGMDNLARLCRLAKFPIICANYDFTGTPCEGVVKPYTVIVRNGVRIGVFGLSPVLEGLVTWKNCENVKFLDPIETSRKMVTQLREVEKCDMVICLSHLGYEADGVDDKALVTATSGIDLVLGGHTHTYLEHPAKVENANGKVVEIDQNGKSGIFLSRFSVALQP